MVGDAYFTIAVIIITCGVSFYGFQSAAFREKYFFWPEAILAWKEWYRIITSAFLHLDPFHLAANMVTLYLFGKWIEFGFGWGNLLLIYAASIVGGSLLGLYIHRFHDYRALGASGGVSGVLLAYTLLFPGSNLGFIFFPIPIPASIYAIAYLLASFIGMHRQLNNVGHDAHLGGALVGLYTAAALHPNHIGMCPWWFASISVGTILLFMYMSRDAMYVPLEGFDFTKRRSRPIPWRPQRAGWFNLNFNFGRKKKAAVPASPVELNREVDAILQKISEQGIHSLTKEEHDLLQKVSQKHREREKRDKPKSGFPF